MDWERLMAKGGRDVIGWRQGARVVQYCDGGKKRRSEDVDVGAMRMECVCNSALNNSR